MFSFLDSVGEGKSYYSVTLVVKSRRPSHDLLDHCSYDTVLLQERLFVALLRHNIKLYDRTNSLATSH